MTARGSMRPFNMDPYRRQMLLEGLDEIGRTLREESRITAYETAMEALGRPRDAVPHRGARRATASARR